MSDALTLDSLKSILGREVEEIHLTVAKSNALGLDSEVIARTLGVAEIEVKALMESADYKDIRLLVGAEQAKERIERDCGWDEIESIALRKLRRRSELENDTDTLVRIAAVANRATRRVAPPRESVLDPSQASARVPLTLTRRFTDKLNDAGNVIERTEIQQISVLNGSAVNPTFAEVNSLLQGQAPPPAKSPLTSQAQIEQQAAADVEGDFSFEELKKMAEGMRNG